jgi:hypothetical protein
LLGSITAEKAGEARVTAERLQIGVAPEVVQVTVAEPEGPLKGLEGTLGHAEKGVATREVIPGDGFVGAKPDELQVGLEGPVIVAFGGQVVGVDLQGVAVKRVSFEHAAEEIEFKLKLALLATLLSGRFRDRGFEGVVRSIMGCGHSSDLPFPAWDVRAEALPAGSRGTIVIRCSQDSRYHPPNQAACLGFSRHDA